MLGEKNRENKGRVTGSSQTHTKNGENKNKQGGVERRREGETRGRRAGNTLPQPSPS